VLLAPSVSKPAIVRWSSAYARRAPAVCGTGRRVSCQQAPDPPGDLREPRARAGPNNRNDHARPDGRRAARRDRCVLPGRAPRGERVVGRWRRPLTFRSGRRRARRGWNNVTAGDATVSGVTLWSSAGHSVTCRERLCCCVTFWQPAGAFGLLNSSELHPPASPGWLRSTCVCAPTSALAGRTHIDTKGPRENYCGFPTAIRRLEASGATGSSVATKGSRERAGGASHSSQ
jgi:hypothetical protein